MINNCVEESGVLGPARMCCVMCRNICTIFFLFFFRSHPHAVHEMNLPIRSIYVKVIFLPFIYIYFLFREEEKKPRHTLQFNTFNGVREIFNKLQYLRCWSVFHLSSFTLYVATTTMATWRHACNSATLASRAHNMQFDAVSQCTNNAN